MAIIMQESFSQQWYPQAVTTSLSHAITRKDSVCMHVRVYVYTSTTIIYVHICICIIVQIYANKIGLLCNATTFGLEASKHHKFEDCIQPLERFLPRGSHLLLRRIQQTRSIQCTRAIFSIVPLTKQRRISLRAHVLSSKKVPDGYALRVRAENCSV